MHNSSRPSSSGKIKKRHPDFPLTPHPNGRWCKEVKGMLHDFGKAIPDDCEASARAALDLWLEQKADLLAGRVPRSKQGQAGPTWKDVCNTFLTPKASLRESDELSL